MSIYCIIFVLCLTEPNLHVQALQKICLADHIRKMANQLHADAIQQLEVALLGSPAAEVMDILSASLSKPVTIASAQPHPHTFTATPPGPPPASVPLEGIPELSSLPVTVNMGSFKPDEEIPLTLEPPKQRSLSFPCWLPNAIESPPP